jgi:hypothetical protein
LQLAEHGIEFLISILEETKEQLNTGITKLSEAIQNQLKKMHQKKPPVINSSSAFMNCS